MSNCVKIKEMKFEKLDKKKFKDRCLDIFAEMKGASNDRVSLRQIDQINKKGKEEKIELFMKLLKR